jgi:hypothetical protein
MFGVQGTSSRFAAVGACALLVLAGMGVVCFCRWCTASRPQWWSRSRVAWWGWWGVASTAIVDMVGGTVGITAVMAAGMTAATATVLEPT